jgi:4a-hydroxytetrahydrobiopterin dehydratase
MKLSDSEVTAALVDFPGWSRTKIGNSEALTRRVSFPTFPSLIEAVNQIAVAAEKANHHPDLDIRYTNLTIYLTSHDAGGITSRDLKMAKQISAILPS